MNKLIYYDAIANEVAEKMASSEVLHDYNLAIEKANKQAILLRRKFETLRVELDDFLKNDVKRTVG